jgi:hypothetical protein
MNNQSIGNNETFFGNKEMSIADVTIGAVDNNTRVSDTSREFRE